MKINGTLENQVKSQQPSKLQEARTGDVKTSDVKTIESKTSLHSKAELLPEDRFENYNKKGMTQAIASRSTSPISDFDKGTAATTTVFVSRQVYDQIAYATTYGDVKWQEMGVDDNKRWIVINGQRFETEHSPEEKALRKKLANTSLVNLLNQSDRDKKDTKKGQDNGPGMPRGNIEALKSNREVMSLLGRIFNASSDEAILSHLSSL